MPDILGQHGGPIFRGQMSFEENWTFAPWSWDHHVSKKHRATITQWHGATSQQEERAWLHHHKRLNTQQNKVSQQ